MFQKFQIFKKVLKQANSLKNLKKTSIFFCLVTFTWEGKISLIKKAGFMLFFLNLKLKPIRFFGSI